MGGKEDHSGEQDESGAPTRKGEEEKGWGEKRVPAGTWLALPHPNCSLGARAQWVLDVSKMRAQGKAKMSHRRSKRYFCSSSMRRPTTN